MKGPVRCTLRTGLLIAGTLIAAFFGCELPQTSHSIDHTIGTEPVRPWRITLVLFDRNELHSYFESDVSELAVSPDSATVARIAVTSSTFDTTAGYRAAGGERIPIRHGSSTDQSASSGASPLHSTDGLIAALEAARRHAPAEREVVIIAGHGRDWLGIGYDDNDATATLDPVSLAEALRTTSETDAVTQSRILVLDAGWSALAEVLAPLSLSTTQSLTVIAPHGERSIHGLDYTALVDWFARVQPADTDSAVAGIVDLFPADSTVTIDAAGRAALGNAIATVATHGSAGISSIDAQRALRDALMAHVTYGTVPGRGYIALGDAAGACGTPVLPQLGDVLLMLTDLDELGWPSGHPLSYRTDTEESRLSPSFTAFGWAPNIVARHGFLFDLWYRDF